MHRATLGIGLTVVLAGAAFALWHSDGAPSSRPVGDDVDAQGGAGETTAGAPRAPGSIGAGAPGTAPSGVGATASSPASAPHDAEPPSVRRTVRGRVLDAHHHAPIRDVQVVEVSHEAPGRTDTERSDVAEGFGPSARGQAARATSGADGTYAVSIPPGRAVTLAFAAQGYCPRVVTVAPEQDVLDVDLSAGIAIAGVVVSARGVPIEGAVVASVVTAADGRFTAIIDARRPTGLRVAHPTHVAVGLVVGPAAPSEPLRIVLPGAFVAWFRVATDDGSTPRAVRTTWSAAGRVGQATGWTNAVGDARAAAPRPGAVGPLKFPVDAEGGEATIAVAAIGYRAWTTTVSGLAPDGEVRVLDVGLERDPAIGRVRVRLEGADGTALRYEADAPLVVTRADGAPIASWASSETPEGDVDLDGLLPGPHHVRVWLDGRGPADVDLDVVAGANPVAVARAAAEARLRIRVAGTGGRRALVRVLSGGRAAFPSVAEDPSGRARPQRVAVSGVDSVVVLVGEEGVVLGGLPAGATRIEVVSPDIAAAPVDVDLRAGETGSAEIAGTVR